MKKIIFLTLLTLIVFNAEAGWPPNPRYCSKHKGYHQDIAGYYFLCSWQTKTLQP